jgi:hypothetical protein
MRRRTRPLLAAGLLSLALGCAPTETGNPPEEPKALLGATSSEPDQVGLVPTPGIATVQAAWHAIERLGYMSCDGQAAYLLDEPRAVDLVSGRGGVISGEVPPGTYCSLLMGVSPIAAAAGIPAELETYTCYFTGIRQDGIAFEVVGDDIGLERAFAGGALELSDSSAPLLLQVDVARLYPLLGVVDATPDTDGVVRVDRSLTGSPGTFAADWASSWTLHSDDNKNGRVDPGEPALF